MTSLLERLSPRACSMFRPRAPAQGRPSTPEAIAARLVACNRPVFDAAVQFELSVLELEWPGHELGIIYYEPDPETDDPDDPERTMVPIGSTWTRNTTLFMGERGEIAYYAGYVAMQNASIWSCFEQHAMSEVHRFACPWFSLRFGPPVVGPALAAALQLDPVPAATDEFETWWTGDDIELGQRFFFDGDTPIAGWIHARTLRALASAIAAVQRLCPSIRLHVGAVPTDTSAGLARRAALAPPVELWGRLPAATRSPHGPDASQAVWLVEGPRGVEIEQYFGDMWETFGPRGGIRREWGKHPWNPGEPPVSRPGLDEATAAARARWLASLSPRARSFMLGHAREAAWASPRPLDRAGILAKMRAYNFEPVESLVAFEMLLGGLDLEILDETLRLGLAYGYLSSGRPAVCEATSALSVTNDGEIVGNDARAPFPRSASVASFIEQLALLGEATLGPTPAFTVDVHGADAHQLSEALAVAIVEEATDRYQEWWSGGDVILFRSFVPDRATPEIVRAYTRRLADVVRVLDAAAARAPEVRFDLGCTTWKVETCAREALLESPADRMPDGRRYRHGSSSAYVDGEITVAAGSCARIDQRRALDGVVYGWDTLTEDGAVCRIVREVP